MWRASHNSLPKKENLVQRIMLDSPICDRYHAALESPLHALQSCPKLYVVWSDKVLWNFRRSHQFVDFKELLSWIIQQGRNSTLFAMTAWLIWNQHNKVRLAQSTCNFHHLAQVSSDKYHEFLALHPLQVLPQSQPCVSWSPSSFGCSKLILIELLSQQRIIVALVL